MIINKSSFKSEEKAIHKFLHDLNKVAIGKNNFYTASKVTKLTQDISHSLSGIESELGYSDLPF